VLKARGRSSDDVKEAVRALEEIFKIYMMKTVKTVDPDLIVKQSEIEKKYGLSFFDSLIASSALKLDKSIISDDKAFDNVPELKRIPISKFKP
jgi:predicted nucleic acid-binding protein